MIMVQIYKQNLWSRIPYLRKKLPENQKHLFVHNKVWTFLCKFAQLNYCNEMNKQQLIDNIRAKHSFLCVGLDTDLKKIPEHLLKEEDPIFAFNKAIIDATAPYCVAYKPNLAF